MKRGRETSPALEEIGLTTDISPPVRPRPASNRLPSGVVLAAAALVLDIDGEASPAEGVVALLPVESREIPAADGAKVHRRGAAAEAFAWGG